MYQVTFVFSDLCNQPCPQILIYPEVVDYLCHMVSKSAVREINEHKTQCLRFIVIEKLRLAPGSNHRLLI
jgi:hypothetical protein